MTKKKQNAVWQKVERDQALNVSELAEASGYSRASLRQMKVPLVCGKIPYSDFRRFLQKLEDDEFAAAQGDSVARAEPEPCRSADPLIREYAHKLLHAPHPMNARTRRQFKTDIQALVDKIRRTDG
jgi:hypothetical protein